RPRELHFVQPCSIDRERDRPLVPVHPPHVKGSRPFGIVEALQRLPGISPDRQKRLRTAPRYIGEQRAAVILHDVDLAAVRPWAGDPERPEGGPQTRPGIDAADRKST